MSGNPKVNVLMASYNYQDFVQDAIQSVFSQNYPKEDLMLTIVDDCSPDNSVYMIDEYLFSEKGEGAKSRENYSEQDTDKFFLRSAVVGGIQVVFVAMKQNVGVSAARNIGIKMTLDSCDAFQILDCDDVMYSTKVAKLAKYMMQSSDIGAVYADYDIHNLINGTMFREYKKPFDFELLKQECIVHSGSLVRADAIRKLGGFDEEMRTCEDWDLWLKIAHYYTIGHIPEPLTMVRVHKNNSTFTAGEDVWNKNWSRISRKLHEQSYSQAVEE